MSEAFDETAADCERARDRHARLLIAPFADFEFMRRALVGALALALAGAPIGVFLILRRMALSGDAMAHAILPGAALGYLVAGLSLPAMTLGGLARALPSRLLVRRRGARDDPARRTPRSPALPRVAGARRHASSPLRGSNVDLLHVLFGNVLALWTTRPCSRFRPSRRRRWSLRADLSPAR